MITTNYEKFLEELEIGTMTNKGKVMWMDNPYKTSGRSFKENPDRLPGEDMGEWSVDPNDVGKDADISVKTDKGWFKLSELQPVDQPAVVEIPSETKVPTNVKPEIEFPDSQKLDIRVCKVENCQKVPKKDKLLLLTINTGFDERKVVTNLGSHYAPEQLQGKCFAFILNLKPAKIGGIDSNGMIIAASHDGKPYLVEMNVPVGSVIL